MRDSLNLKLTSECQERTAIVGQVQTEVSCLPVENDEYRRVMDERTLQEMKPQRRTGYVPESSSMQGGNVLAPGTLGTPGNFANFIVRHTRAVAKDKILICTENYGSTTR